MPQKFPAERLPGLLRPSMTVFVQGASGEPTPLLEALAAAPETSDGVHYVACFVPNVNRIDPASFHPSARLTSFFVFGDIARSHAAGKVRFLPLHYSGIWAYLTLLEPIDLALIQVSPPDRSGNCSLGVSVHFVPAVLDRARTIVAEVNAAMPRAAHGYQIAYDRLDYVVETERPLVALATGDLPPQIHRIGEHVASLIEDGDTIQIGIGKVPAAVLASLESRRDLGLHGGLVSDEVAELHAAGVLTGARKSHEPGMVCTAALGSARVYDWAGRCSDLRFAPVSYTHDVRVIAQIDRFVAINSVVAIDLSGQANAEMVDGRQVSGTGGLLDFVRGAHLSEGGRSILALPSTAGGKASRIVARLGERDIVSCPRADADIVVTEHGIAHLRGRSIDERAAALITIAEPAFRDTLGEQWMKARCRDRPSG
jgi:4-hydroxybutyrate CoA-transferase